MAPGTTKGSTSIRSITERPSLAPSSPTRRTVGCACASLSWTGGRRAYHVSPRLPRWVRSRLSAGGSTTAPEEFGASGPGHVPFWSKPNLKPPHSGHDYRRSSGFSIFGLSYATTFSSASPELTVPPILVPNPLDARSRSLGLAAVAALRRRRLRYDGSFAPHGCP